MTINIAPVEERLAMAQTVTNQPDGPGKRIGKRGELTMIGNFLSPRRFSNLCSFFGESAMICPSAEIQSGQVLSARHWPISP